MLIHPHPLFDHGDLIAAGVGADVDALLRAR
jgi:hypothetical protein